MREEGLDMRQHGISRPWQLKSDWVDEDIVTLS
jgi:hypothetical protein